MATYSPQTKAVFEILSSQPIAYHPLLAKMLGGVTCGVLMSQLLYWNGKQRDKNGWIKKTVAELREETSLTENEQEGARGKLLALGVIEYTRKGLPAMPHYRINYERLAELAVSYTNPSQLAENSLTSETIPDGDLLAENRLTNTKITSETTPNITAPQADAGKSSEEFLEYKIPDPVLPNTSEPSEPADYLQNVFNRKRAAARENELKTAIKDKVKNEAHRAACLVFADEFPDCIFDFGEWIGRKGENIEKFITHFEGDNPRLKRAVELNKKAAKDNPMFLARSPVMLVRYLDAARGNTSKSPATKFEINGFAFEGL